MDNPTIRLNKCTPPWGLFYKILDGRNCYHIEIS
jgi:hypothetical protein